MTGDELELISGLDGDEYELISGLIDEDGDDDGIAELVQLAGAAGNNTSMRGGVDKAQLKQLMLAKLGAGSTLLRETGPTKARVWHLGFDSESVVPAGATRTIENQPQIVFKGHRLVVPSDIAGSFLIRDIVVGKTSQLAATGSVPARTYVELAVGTGLELDTAQVSQKISLLVENISAADARFNATLIGKAVE